MRTRAILIGAGAYALATVVCTWLVLAVLTDAAGAKPYSDPAWNAAPAYGVVIDAAGLRAIPSGVCPFGISDLAAYRGRDRRDWAVAFTGTGKIVNVSSRAVRAYVWCG
jgi:hypothetical protein